jgi:hypothetical protein
MASALALALFVTRVGADYTDDTLAANDFAILAKLLNRCANFHSGQIVSFSKIIRPVDKS